MKIAKKVLAVVMALAMIGALSVMALAADGQYVLTKGEEDGYVTIAISLKNGAGATSDSFTVKYDKTVLKIADPENDYLDGKDVEDMGNVNGNQIMGIPNFENEGEVVYGYVFSEDLTQEHLKAKKGKTVSIDPNDFEFLVLYFTVVNDKADTTVTVTSDNFAGSSVAVKGAAEEPDSTPVEPVKPDDPKDDPKDEPKDEPKEEPSKAVNPNNGDKKTGDNMALAAAGAVVALAGVAFVISKKRK